MDGARAIGSNLQRSDLVLAGLTLLAAILFVGALAGMGDLAGYGAVLDRLRSVRWEWLLASAGGVAAAFAGYHVAYDGISRVEGGPELGFADRTAVVAAGFGGFVARGGSTVDRYALESAGADEREARVRVYGLEALEHLPIAVFGCAAGIAIIVHGVGKHPPADFVWPWAVAPPLGAALAWWIVPRYRERWRDRSGWRGHAAVALDGIWMLWRLVRTMPDRGLAVGGMTIFWAADIFALWAAVRAFGFAGSPSAVVLAFLIGYAVTRRFAPLGGAGFIETTLTLTLWDAGVPLPAAVAGVLAYRVFNLWAPMPFAFAALPRLRALGEEANTRGEAALADRGDRTPLRKLLFSSHRDHGTSAIAIAVGASAILAVGASVGVAGAAGFERVAHVLRTPTLFWLLIAIAGAAASYVGYLLAYRETIRVDDGPSLPLTHLGALVAAGFGLFIPRGGFAVDVAELREAGFNERDARVRVLGLGALEYAVLAPAACVAAVYLLVRGAQIGGGLTWPWASGVPAGFVLAPLAFVYLARFRGRHGWRAGVAHALDAIELLGKLARHGREHGAVAVAGMALYWTSDIFMLWAMLHAFLDRAPSIPALVVGYATGYALTRRTLPLAGAGVVEAFMPFALTWVDIPLPAAVVAVFAYRVLNLWLPLVPALAGRHVLRQR